MKHPMGESQRREYDMNNIQSDRLRAYSDAQLQGELNRRTEERAKKIAADRAAREVEIVCPNCEDNEYIQSCRWCAGTRKIRARRPR